MKFLVDVTDFRFTLTRHISYLATKISENIYVLKKFPSSLSGSVLKSASAIWYNGMWTCIGKRKDIQIILLHWCAIRVVAGIIYQVSLKELRRMTALLYSNVLKYKMIPI